MLVFLLIHSPLVGPFTWALVAEELRQLGHIAIVPHLTNDEQSNLPYFEQHAQAIANAYKVQAAGQSAIIVGHSGAGMLLPLAGEAIGHLESYIFVDAGLPTKAASRLDTFAPDDAERFRQAARDNGGYIPLWTDEVLARVIPDAEARQQFVAELQPTPLAVYEERIPVPETWPDAPCSYLSFNKGTSYDLDIRAAQELGWAYAELPGYHFHTLVDPAAVAQALVSLAQRA